MLHAVMGRRIGIDFWCLLSAVAGRAILQRSRDTASRRGAVRSAASVISPAERRRRLLSGRDDSEVSLAGTKSWPLPNRWFGVSVEGFAFSALWICCNPLPHSDGLVLNLCSSGSDRRPCRLATGCSTYSAAAIMRSMAPAGYSVKGPGWQPLDWVVVRGNRRQRTTDAG
jgi:hypothetical protein